MTKLFGEEVTINRVFWEARKGDIAVVLKVKVLNAEELAEIGYEVGLLSFALPIDFGGADEEYMPAALRWLARQFIVAHSMTFLGGTDYPGGPLRHAE